MRRRGVKIKHPRIGQKVKVTRHSSPIATNTKKEDGPKKNKKNRKSTLKKTRGNK